MGCGKSKVSSSPQSSRKNGARGAADNRDEATEPNRNRSKENGRAAHSKSSASTNGEATVLGGEGADDTLSAMGSGGSSGPSRKHTPSPTHINQDRIAKDGKPPSKPSDGVEVLPQQRRPVLSESQADFFRMLDDKIAAGNDYEPSEAGSRRPSARSKLRTKVT